MSAIPEFTVRIALTEEEARQFCADGNVIAQPRFPKVIANVIAAIESQLRIDLAKHQPLAVGDRVYVNSKTRTGTILAFLDTPDGRYITLKLDDAKKMPVSTYPAKDVRRLQEEEVDAVTP